LIFTFSSTLWSENRVDSLLNILDQTISQSSHYEDIKNKKIIKLKQKLKEKKQTKEKQYLTNNLLFAEYEAYNFDSAMHYMNLNLQIATELENELMLNESKLRKTRLLSIAGIYVEGMKLIESIDKSTLTLEQLRAYYIEYKNLYLYQAEYASGSEYREEYLRKMNLYLDSALSILPLNSYQYTTTKVSILINNQQIDEAEKILLDFLKRTSSDTREYSITTSILAFLYSFENRMELRKEYLIRSAISDIKAVVKENNSIRTLGEILYEEGKTERAYNYMKISMDDANYFNARLRNLQSSKMLSIINKTYLAEKIEQQKRTQILLIIISILSIILLMAVIYVIMQMKRLSRARQEVQIINIELQKLNADLSEVNNRLHQTNNTLKESNIIKDEYLGRFLDLCSKYIDSIENYRKMLNKKATTGKMDDLLKILKSTKFSDDELKDLYHNFDTAFLKIFPNFVESFNLLLPDSEQIIPKKEEQLTTELRIYALIRLGIIESGQIANFLRFSITTVYSYRSKMRVRSLYKENFEEQVLKIGTF
jgi:hypothetical protein